MITDIASLPFHIRKLAAIWSRSMPEKLRDKQAAIRALPDRGCLSLTEAREACEEAAGLIREKRQYKETKRISQRLGIPITMWGYLKRKPRTGTPGRRPVKLPEGTPAERLEKLRKNAIEIIYNINYRVPRSHHGSLTVHLTRDPAAVGVQQTQSIDWTIRGKRARFPVYITDTIITIPRDWRIRVQRKGLALLDGLLTLDASPLEGAPPSVDLYAAVWLVQGRGYAVTAVRGFIARQGDITYHGDTPTKALAGLRRKIAGAQWAAKLQTYNLDSLLARFPDAAFDAIQVRVSDARAIGACEYGIRSWCHATGLDYAAGQASLRQVWQAYNAQPRPEARATILHTLRRHKHLSRHI